MTRLLLSALLLVPSPALAAKIHVDHDPSTEFSGYLTFQFREAGRDLRPVSSALHEWVARQIIGYARAGGLALVPAEPDLYLTYHAADRGELRLAPRDLEYDYGDDFMPGSYWQGGGGKRDSAAGSFTFKKGAVVVDVWERERRVLVWRGVASAVLERGNSGNELRLAKAIERLMKRWEAMYGGPL